MIRLLLWTKYPSVRSDLAHISNSFSIYFYNCTRPKNKPVNVINKLQVWFFTVVVWISWFFLQVRSNVQSSAFL